MKRRLLTISLILALLSVVFYISDWDTPILVFFTRLRTPALTRLMHVVAFMGSVRFLLPFNLLFILFTFREERWHSLCIPLGTLSVWILNSLIKNIVKRQRPAISALALEKSLSFPSGHAMVSSFFIMSLAMRYYKKHHKSAVFVFAALYILLMGINRIYLGVHFPSDVLAGSSFGLFLFALTLPSETGRKPSKI